MDFISTPLPAHAVARCLLPTADPVYASGHSTATFFPPIVPVILKLPIFRAPGSGGIMLSDVEDEKKVLFDGLQARSHHGQTDPRTSPVWRGSRGFGSLLAGSGQFGQVSLGKVTQTAPS
jgi:hypothetical protein